MDTGRQHRQRSVRSSHSNRTPLCRISHSAWFKNSVRSLPQEKWKWIGAAVGGVLGGSMRGAVSLPLLCFLPVPGFIFDVHYGGKVDSGFNAVERVHGEFGTDAVAPSRHAVAFVGAMIVASTGFGYLAGATVLGAVSLPLFGILAVPELLFGMAIGARIGRFLFR